MKEITLEELNEMQSDSYQLIDIRDEGLRLYGMMPKAVAISFDAPKEEYIKKLSEIPAEKKLVFYCQIGRKTTELGEISGLEGRECYSIKGGYLEYIKSSMASDDDIEEIRQKAEESIRKRFHKRLFTPFAKACKTYRLIEEGDHIAVCISGGKDSMLMAKLFQEIQKHRQCNFDLTFLVML